MCNHAAIRPFYCQNRNNTDKEDSVYYECLAPVKLSPGNTSVVNFESRMTSRFW